jgi:phosphate-selective porin OprO/OprP
VEHKDGKIKTRWGGRVHLDWAAIDADGDFEQALIDAGESGPLEGNGVEFRRVRFFSSGTLYDTMGYKVQFDFADKDADLKDAYLDFKKVPYVANNVLRIGQMKEPISLDELTSSNYITFMERALPVQAFAPSRKTGILLWNTALDQRLIWQVGGYYGVEDDSDSGNSFTDFNNYDLAARVAGTPWYRDNTHLLHLGLGYRYQFRDDTEEDARARLRARPETHITDVRLANTGRFFIDSSNLLNPEAAVVFGPFSFQGEYFWNDTDASDADDPTFTGWYVYGSWFITGESRPYSKKSGAFSRVKPKNNFHIGQPGWGAFELGLRYSTIDLTDELIEGGEEDNITAGLNWYINPSVRLMFNYVYADLEKRADVPDDDTNIFQTRVQVDF